MKVQNLQVIMLSYYYTIIINFCLIERVRSCKYTERYKGL